jgi:hypothetical protein
MSSYAAAQLSRQLGRLREDMPHVVCRMSQCTCHMSYVSDVSADIT